MMDRNFCEQLEYKICKVLRELDIDSIKGFWCDGVLQSESEIFYTPKFISDHRKIKLKAFVGKDGQDVYELTLHFGANSLSKVARQLDFIDTFPNTNIDRRFNIDTKQRKIEIQLD